MSKDEKKDAPDRSTPDQARAELPELARKLGMMDLDLDMDETRIDRLKVVLDQLPDQLVVDFRQRIGFETAKMKPSASEFAARFGITKAELKLLSGLVDGLSVSAYADKENISINTARTHMRRLLEKTGAASQTDLVRLFFTSDGQ